MTKQIFRAAAAALVFAFAPACPGDMDDTTAATLPTSTAPPLTVGSSDTTNGGTVNLPTTSGDPSTSSDGDTDIASTENVPTTSAEPETCVDPDVVCDRLVTNATDFCDAIAQFGATRSTEEPYIGFVVAKCEANEPKCEVARD